MIKKNAILFFASILFLLSLGISPAQQSVAGTYRCWMFNVGGRGGRCVIGSPPLVLNADGTYHLSSERGTYMVRGGEVIFSESRIRGPGRLNGSRLSFEYDYQGLHHSVTYLKQGGAASSPSSKHSKYSAVDVEAYVTFTKDDGTLAWINTGILVPNGGSLNGEHWDGIARQQERGSLTIRTGFRDVPAGRSYILYLDTGRQKIEVPITIDLTNPKSNPYQWHYTLDPDFAPHL